MKIRFLSSVAILLALLLPVWADEVAEQVLDPLRSAQTDEVVELVPDPLVPAQADEVVELVPDPLGPVQADEDIAQVRDPFWPVGYSPAIQTATVAVAVAEVKPDVAPEPEIKPVSQEEWDKAIAKLPRAGGIFIGSHPVSKEKVEKMMMNGKVYYAGDYLCQTNEFVAFTWKINSISFKSTRYELSPVTAERIMK